uniref:Uncharacterized protein n=1 Tax=Rhizophora mucronata TaxID=61149 RepID=A0A2P2K430_RHIMU
MYRIDCKVSLIMFSPLMEAWSSHYRSLVSNLCWLT